MIIAIDFDGTLCRDEYPHVGAEITPVVEWVKERIKAGDRFILWTCRVGKELIAAQVWCVNRGIRFEAVNSNLDEHISKYGGDCRKVFADRYVDDRNLFIEEVNQ